MRKPFIAVAVSAFAAYAAYDALAQERDLHGVPLARKGEGMQDYCARIGQPYESSGGTEKCDPGASSSSGGSLSGDDYIEALRPKGRTSLDDFLGKLTRPPPPPPRGEWPFERLLPWGKSSNVITDGAGGFTCENGYRAAGKNVDRYRPSTLRCRWVPGVHGDEGLLSSDAQDKWVLKDGYEWGDPDDESDFSTRWVPGRPSINDPRLIAGTNPSSWRPADGYSWEEDDHTFRGRQNDREFLMETQDRNHPHRRLYWAQFVPSRVWSNLIASDLEGRWIPKDGYSWVNSRVPNDMRVRWTPGLQRRTQPSFMAGPTPDTWVPYRPPSPPIQRTEPPSPIPSIRAPTVSYGADGGLHVPFGVLAYNLPPRLRNSPDALESAGREYRRRMEAAGVPVDEMQRPEQYNFVLGLAFESPTLDAFRVFADQLFNGRGTAVLQPAYNILLGCRFEKLDCHSNGAMVCLAALSRTDERRLRADEVRLLGPQITRDALEEWRKLLENGVVKRLEIVLSDRDFVPILSYTLSDLAFGLGTNQGRLLARVEEIHSRGLDWKIQRQIPDAIVTTYECAESRYAEATSSTAGPARWQESCHHFRAYQDFTLRRPNP